MTPPEETSSAKWPANDLKEIKFSKDINLVLAEVKKLEAAAAGIQWDILDRKQVYANTAAMPHAVIEQGYKDAAVQAQKVILSLKGEAVAACKLAGEFSREADKFAKEYKDKIAKKIIPTGNKLKQVDKAALYLKTLATRLGDYSADIVTHANASIADWVTEMHAAEARDAAGHAPAAPPRPAAGPHAPAAAPHAAAAAAPQRPGSAPPAPHAPASPPSPPRPAAPPRAAAPATPPRPAAAAPGGSRPAPAPATPSRPAAAPPAGAAAAKPK